MKHPLMILDEIERGLEYHAGLELSGRATINPAELQRLRTAIEELTVENNELSNKLVSQQAQAFPTGVQRIAEERRRQIELCGHTTRKDRTTYRRHELVVAAMAYAKASVDFGLLDGGKPPRGWPWPVDHWKPSPISTRNLEKAGALIAAQLDAVASSLEGGDLHAQMNQGNDTFEFVDRLTFPLARSLAIAITGVYGHPKFMPDQARRIMYRLSKQWPALVKELGSAPWPAYDPSPEGGGHE